MAKGRQQEQSEGEGADGSRPKRSKGDKRPGAEDVAGGQARKAPRDGSGEDATGKNLAKDKQKRKQVVDAAEQDSVPNKRAKGPAADEAGEAGDEDGVPEVADGDAGTSAQGDLDGRTKKKKDKKDKNKGDKGVTNQGAAKVGEGEREQGVNNGVSPSQGGGAQLVAVPGGERAPATIGEGMTINKYSRGACDDEWDKKLPNQKFGAWSDGEINEIKTRIKDWAAAHDCLDEYEKGDFGFMFKRRKKQGGRGAKLPRSSRAAFLEISKDFGTRNPKQIYAWISRHLNADNYKGEWTQEQIQQLQTLVDEKGQKWTEIGAIIGRTNSACRDKWRLMAKDNHNRGKWSEEEVAKLKELVENYFRKEGSGPGRGPGDGAEHRFLKDNINWVSIAKQLGTRSEFMCSQKWYQIAPSAVSAGQWGSGEDRILLTELLKGDYPTEALVPWSTLVPNRSLSQIKRRWKLMKVCIPNYVNLGLEELLTLVVDKFAPDLMTAVEQPEQAA